MSQAPFNLDFKGHPLLAPPIPSREFVDIKRKCKTRDCARCKTLRPKTYRMCRVRR